MKLVAPITQAALVAFVFALRVIAAPTSSAEPSIATAARPAVHAWVQLVTGGAVIRAVVSGGHCPTATIDGRLVSMDMRATADASFPNTVCETKLPTGVAQAMVGESQLPIPGNSPRRILIFGDTGCRLKGAAVQDCNNPRAWPFAEIVRRAAAEKPDLVIHVGDYYYRETPCPAGHAGCAGSPYGDNWSSWAAEFFDPASPLLATSPWVFVRGNHENCARGGGGWFRLLDAASPAIKCPAASGPFKVELDGLNLYILDSADAEDRSAPPAAVEAFSRQLDALKAELAVGKGWIVTHRPVWGQVAVARVGPIGPLNMAINATEQRAVRGRDLAGVQMVVSGHIHHFASISFGATRPAQLIAGTGGDVGDPADTPKLRAEAVRIDGRSAETLTFERYGYLLLERHGSDWTGTFHGLDGGVIALCSLRGRALNCRGAHAGA